MEDPFAGCVPVSSASFGPPRPGDTGTPAERRSVRLALALRADNHTRLGVLLAGERTALESSARRVLSCRMSAEDAVQDAALRAMSTPNQFNPEKVAKADIPKAFRSWFYSILTNVCLDMARASVRQVRGVPFTSLPEVVIEAASVDPEPGPAAQFSRKEAMDTYMGDNGHPVEAGDVRYVLERMRGKDKWVLQECIVAEREEIAVAKALRITPGAVRSRLMTAKHILRLGVRDCEVQRRLEGTDE